MKEQLKAIIQKEAERRFPPLEFGGHYAKMEQINKALQFTLDHQWLIDAIPAALQGEDRWVSVEEAIEDIRQTTLHVERTLDRNMVYEEYWGYIVTLLKSKYNLTKK